MLRLSWLSHGGPRPPSPPGCHNAWDLCTPVGTGEDTMPLHPQGSSSPAGTLRLSLFGRQPQQYLGSGGS